MTRLRGLPAGTGGPSDGAGRSDGEDGFSLLEALVALAIIGSGLGAIYVLQAQLATNLERAEQAAERADALTTAVEFARAIDPIETPAGEADIGDWRVIWTSEPEAAPAPTIRAYRTAETRTAQLFRLTLSVTGPEGETIAGPANVTVLSYQSPVRERGGAFDAP